MDPSESSGCRHAEMSRPRHAHPGTSGFARFLLPLTGLAATIWMLIRIIPKPSRAEYPCMKVAAPLASGFLAYIAGMAIALFSLKKATLLYRNHRTILAALLIACAIGVGSFTLLRTDTESRAAVFATDSLFVPSDPPNTPMGVARGIFPGRVVWMWDSTATTWNGLIGNWWNDTYTHQTVVDSMLKKSLLELTGKSTEAAAWDTLFKYFNLKHGNGNVGYTSGEKIAIKINLVQTSFPGSPGNAVFVSPQLALSLLRQLVSIAGVPDSDITIYDTDRYVPDPIYNKCKPAYPGVHYMGWASGNGREQYVRDTTYIHWSEKLTMEINGGNTAYLPTVVTRATYLINLASFKAHRYMGLTLCSKNHFGTLSCSDSTGAPYQNAPHAAGLHCYTAVHDITIPGSAEWTFKGRPMGSYNTLVDLMGHKDLGAKTVLFMIDGLYAVEEEDHWVSLASRWKSSPFNNHWSSSLFLSQDNIAIESVGLDFLRTEQSVNSNYTLTYGAVDNYLHEGSQADNPPSGTYYSPNGDSVRLPSLGVHEHWNNATEKKYSRNLGTGNGIELVQMQNTITAVKEPPKPAQFALYQNYPNPFNPSTTIRYSLSGRSTVTLNVYNTVGQLVATLVKGEQEAGMHEVKFDGTKLASGVYYYRIHSESFDQARKLLLVR
ncbi:MAG TPA: DUF362 domain-containing protein [Bacteroidota bacterium]|nr:DUF362 domain-containing protein [Bacteroidota bacterium]